MNQRFISFEQFFLYLTIISAFTGTLGVAGSVTVFVILGTFFVVDSEDLTRFKSFFFESMHYIHNRIVW